MTDRATELLKAVLEIMNKCDDGSYVKDFMSETAFYDDTDCDEYCLKQDIEHYLEYGPE